MWLKAQNEMEGLWPHAAMGPVERMVRPHREAVIISATSAGCPSAMIRYQLSD